MGHSDELSPLYARVRSALRAAIRSGELGPGAILPSEKDLEAAHGVSRITVRRALEELEREGLVVRGRGRQARVVEPLISAIRTEIEDDLASMLELVRGTEAEVLAFKWLLPDPEVCNRLGVPADEPVLRVDRLRRLDGRPILHTTAHVPPWVGARLQRDTLSERTMLDTLARSGVRLAAAAQEMRAAACSPAVAPLIGLAAGEPVFVIERLVSDEAGRSVQHLLATFRWDSFSYRITSTGSAAGRRVEIAGAGRLGAHNAGDT